ncbi:uncharacterized protein EI90DRAFT_3239241 [Cantharellus anzutake]|uniref:uncharacterized protein n=1 Tax=Cantharellus anzutake TaxID=1750568 RepID=UPI0019046E11|nr:uncharacterized protein EI90DRAFT_3239241 [Cantharellus anzutake]KAF8324990.1 hypothetical protein EI90DRAFT_3239241 [Cantharellus anzutake]
MNKFFASLFFLLLLSINSAFAIIGSIEAPKNILRPGHTFTVTFLTHPHIIQNAQYYVIFGLQPGIVPPLVRTTPSKKKEKFVLTAAVFQTVWRSSMEMSPSLRTESTEDVAFNMRRRIDERTGLSNRSSALYICYVDEFSSNGACTTEPENPSANSAS